MCGTEDNRAFPLSAELSDILERFFIDDDLLVHSREHFLHGLAHYSKRFMVVIADDGLDILDGNLLDFSVDFLFRDVLQ